MAVGGAFRVEPHPVLKCGEGVRHAGSLADVEGIVCSEEDLYRLGPTRERCQAASDN
jgi:hypothetical protein